MENDWIGMKGKKYGKNDGFWIEKKIWKGEMEYNYFKKKIMRKGDI